MIAFAEHSITDHEIWEEVTMYVPKLDKYQKQKIFVN